MCLQTTAAAAPRGSSTSGGPPATEAIHIDEKLHTGDRHPQAIPQVRTLLDFAAWVVLSGSQRKPLQNGSHVTAFVLAEEMPALPDAVKRVKVRLISAGLLPDDSLGIHAT